MKNMEKDPLTIQSALNQLEVIAQINKTDQNRQIDSNVINNEIIDEQEI